MTWPAPRFSVYQHAHSPALSPRLTGYPLFSSDRDRGRFGPALRSRPTGRTPDSGSGCWRFESSLLSTSVARSHRLAVRTAASHVANRGSIPRGTTFYDGSSSSCRWPNARVATFASIASRLAKQFGLIWG